MQGILSSRKLYVVMVFTFGVSGILPVFGFADSGVGTKEAKKAESRAEKKALIVTDDYIIGPEDALEISVWRTPELSRQVIVRPDGRVSLPLIGDVKAVGLTTLELRDRITEQLKSYKENPTVAIVVVAVNSYYFYTQGAVGNTGKIPLLSRTTLIQAITLAGGLAPDAVRSRITIFRLGRDNDAPQKIVVSYDDIILRGA
ncbi:MAG: polysaccharide biosynthesis/export family protein, partial [Nitrospirota bacterium]|nr:polysaccharide biosynthesis/export family protein [Nitrospirota bacterium]